MFDQWAQRRMNNNIFHDTSLNEYELADLVWLKILLKDRKYSIR